MAFIRASTHSTATLISCVLFISLFGAAAGHGPACEHSQVAETIQVLETQQAVSYDKAAASPLRLSFVSDFSASCGSKGQIVKAYQSVCNSSQQYVCTANDVLTADKQAYIASLLVTAQSTLAALINVANPIEGNLMIASSRCCQASTAGQQAQANTDLAVFVNFMPSPVSTSNTVAFSSTCEIDASTKRPTVGFININPKLVTVGKQDADLKAIMHELTHLLGFTTPVMASLGITPVRKIKLDGTNSGAGRPVMEIQTPTVVAKVREHFNCPSATGAELEDYDTTMAHWEKSIFGNEYMTATRDATPNPISKITLALLQDMGIYTVNFDAAEPLWNGRNQGCSWLNDKCSARSAPNFCSDYMQYAPKACVADLKALGKCDRATYPKALPEIYQYFPGKPNDGGMDPYNNYCPRVVAMPLYDCADPSITPSAGDVQTGQTYSADSRCFQSSVYSVDFWGITIQGDSYLRCIKTECQQDGTVKAYVGSGTNDFVFCPKAGGVIDLYNELKKLNPSCSEPLTTARQCTKFFGFFNCPAAASICPNAVQSSTISSTTPSSSPSATPSPSRAPSPSRTPAASTSPSASTSASSSASSSRTPSATRTPSTSATPSRPASNPPTPSRTPSRTSSASRTPTRSASASRTPTRSASASRTPAAPVPSRTPSPTRAR